MLVKKLYFFNGALLISKNAFLESQRKNLSTSLPVCDETTRSIVGLLLLPTNTSKQMTPLKPYGFPQKFDATMLWVIKSSIVLSNLLSIDFNIILNDTPSSTKTLLTTWSSTIAVKWSDFIWYFISSFGGSKMMTLWWGVKQDTWVTQTTFGLRDGSSKHSSLA